jgi:hypothetical protein
MALHRLPPECVFEAIRLWDKGFDTLEIVRLLNKEMPRLLITEAAVANSLAHAREKRRMKEDARCHEQST